MSLVECMAALGKSAPAPGWDAHPPNQGLSLRTILHARMRLPIRDSCSGLSKSNPRSRLLLATRLMLYSLAAAEVASRLRIPLMIGIPDPAKSHERHPNSAATSGGVLCLRQTITETNRSVPKKKCQDRHTLWSSFQNSPLSTSYRCL